MRTPRVSVVVPAYNAARWLAQSLDSALQQTLEDIEVIVVDDGSTDDTQSIAEGYSDTRVRVVRQRNTGLSAARNSGIRIARANLIALLDADDIFYPSKLEAQASEFDRNPGLGVVSCGYRVIDEDGRGLGEETPWLLAPDASAAEILFSNPLLPSTLVVRRKWFDQLGGFDESLRCYEDWEFALRFSLHGCPIGWVRDVLVGYRRHEMNRSTDPELISVATNDALDFTNRLFGSQDTPREFLSLRAKATSNVYLDASARAFGAGLNKFGKEWLAAAIEHDPDLLDGVRPRWAVALCGHALGPMTRDRRQYLQNVMFNLPDCVHNFQIWSGRRMMGQYHASAAFHFRQTGRTIRARYSGVKAILSDPSWLANRGLVSICLRPW